MVLQAGRVAVRYSPQHVQMIKIEVKLAVPALPRRRAPSGGLGLASAMNVGDVGRRLPGGADTLDGLRVALLHALQRVKGVQ